MSEKIDQSGSKSRAERLLCLREMSGLSRDKIQHRYGIARGTLQNWESARFGGLTVKGAKSMLKAYLAEGIVCDLDWLLHGIGQGPIYKKKDSLVQIQRDGLKNIMATNGWSDNRTTAIAQELLYFRNSHTHAIDMMVQDDAMSPFYNQGDYIAGIKAYQSDVENLVGKHCIVQTVEHGLMIRQLHRGSKLNRFSLQALNLETKKSTYLPDVEIMFAAEVIWVRSTAFLMPTAYKTTSEEPSLIAG